MHGYYFHYSKTFTSFGVHYLLCLQYTLSVFLTIPDFDLLTMQAVGVGFYFFIFFSVVIPFLEKEREGSSFYKAPNTD